MSDFQVISVTIAFLTERCKKSYICFISGDSKNRMFSFSLFSQVIPADDDLQQMLQQYERNSDKILATSFV